MIDSLKSIFIWLGIVALILIWLPLLAIRRFFDRDQAFYYTGRLFRKLGKAISRVNPNWQITISGNAEINDREPYIMVCNHLSQADIPLISNLPWEMKWVAKKELFELPVVGWMMKLAGDIAVDRRSPHRKVDTFRQAKYYLERNCSIMFFPEGTRSRTGQLQKFSNGAFELAITNNVPLLPMVIDGTQNALPKKSWKFENARHISLKILDPIATEDLDKSDIAGLNRQVRDQIMHQLAQWRNQEPEKIDYFGKGFSES